MVKVSVNSKEFDAQVALAIKAVGDLTIPFTEIAKEFYRSNRFIFKLKSKGQYEDFKGKKGEDGMTPYQRFKQKKTGLNKGYPLLKFTGRLEKSIVEPSSPDAIAIITKSSAVLGTNVEYGKFHQYGTKNLPMRPFLFLDPSTTIYSDVASRRLEAWNKIINSYVMRNLEPLGTTFGGDE